MRTLSKCLLSTDRHGVQPCFARKPLPVFDHSHSPEYFPDARSDPGTALCPSRTSCHRSPGAETGTSLGSCREQRGRLLASFPPAWTTQVPSASLTGQAFQPFSSFVALLWMLSKTLTSWMEITAPPFMVLQLWRPGTTGSITNINNIKKREKRH